MKEWRKKNPDKVIQSNRERISRLNTNQKRQREREWRKNNLERHLVIAAKRRAKVTGLPFNITWKDVTIPERCPVLNIPLFVSSGRGPGPNSPTIDRISGELGYTKGNVAVISWRANCLKRDATPQEILAVANWYLNAIKQ